VAAAIDWLAGTLEDGRLAGGKGGSKLPMGAAVETALGGSASKVVFSGGAALS